MGIGGLLMATVTMEQVINFRSNTDFFSNTNLPLKGAYKLNKIRKQVEKESEFYGEKFQEIVDKYAKKNEDGTLMFSEDGGQIMIQDDKIIECNKELEDLQNLPIEIDTYNLNLEDLGDDLECTPDQLEVLMPFID